MTETQKAQKAIENNRHKVEKDRRRKQYHDLQVQGTNNSSIVLKRSVEALYNPVVDPGNRNWFEVFVAKGKRRSPAINRGYWIRMETVKQMVSRVVVANPGKPVCVVNLGCGFDPLPLQALSGEICPGTNFRFLDFDYPELVQRKLLLMQPSAAVSEVVGLELPISEEDRTKGLVYHTNRYKLIGCNLYNSELYSEQLARFLGQDDPVTVFIAEVLLAYMKAEDADKIASVLARVPNSHMLVLEQIMPAGKDHFFAQKMLYHFAHLGLPLQCVTHYSTKEKQQARFAQWFPEVEVRDLYECWLELVSDDRKARVAVVEAFDEWEEFLVFCQHYVVVHAGPGHVFRLESPKLPELAQDPLLRLQYVGPGPELKFPAVCAAENKIFVHGGMFQSRSDGFFVHALAPEKLAPGPPARMCHTLTANGAGKLVLAGGRGRPGLEMLDVWEYDLADGKWTELGHLPQPMHRHCGVSVGPGQVLLFGNGQFFLISDEIRPLSINGTIPPLAGAALVFHRQRGYIFGGTTDQTGPAFSARAYRFTLENGTINVDLWTENPHFARLGALGAVVGEQAVLIGGAAPTLLGPQDTVVAVELGGGEVRRVAIGPEAWPKGLFLGAGLADKSVLCGGAVCYSFGSLYSGHFRLTHN